MPLPLFVLNGPNLNTLGTREVEIYGPLRLEEIARRCAETAAAQGFAVEFRQSNHEGDLVDWIQEARGSASALILNAAAYSHTSIAIHDALKLLDIPAIEVHLSNIFKREAFRHRSLVSPVVRGVVCGLGAAGYSLAVAAAIALVTDGGAST